MAAQIEHLIETSRRPRIDFKGSFHLLKFPAEMVRPDPAAVGVAAEQTRSSCHVRHVALECGAARYHVFGVRVFFCRRGVRVAGSRGRSVARSQSRTVIARRRFNSSSTKTSFSALQPRSALSKNSLANASPGVSGDAAGERVAGTSVVVSVTRQRLRSKSTSASTECLSLGAPDVETVTQAVQLPGPPGGAPVQRSHQVLGDWVVAHPQRCKPIGSVDGTHRCVVPVALSLRPSAGKVKGDVGLSLLAG